MAHQLSYSVPLQIPHDFVFPRALARDRGSRASNSAGVAELVVDDGVHDEIRVKASNGECQGPGDDLGWEPVHELSHLLLVGGKVHEGHRRKDERERDDDLRSAMPKIPFRFFGIRDLRSRTLCVAQHANHPGGDQVTEMSSRLKWNATMSSRLKWNATMHHEFVGSIDVLPYALRYAMR